MDESSYLKCLVSQLSNRLFPFIGPNNLALCPQCPSPVSRGQLKCDGTRAETRFSLPVKRPSPLKSAGDVSSVDY